MNCAQLKELQISFLKDELSSVEKSSLEKHLLLCESCRLEFNQIELLWSQMDSHSGDSSETFSEQLPSEDLRYRFYSMLDSEMYPEIDATDKENLQNLNDNFNSTPEKLYWMNIFRSWWPAHPQWAFAYSVVVVVMGIFMGQRFSSSETVVASPFTSIAQQEISQIQNELSDLQDLMAFALLNEDSVQAQLQGVIYAIKSDSKDPRVLSLLLDTMDKDNAVNVKLAALDALESFPENLEIKGRIYSAMLVEPSPLLQLRMAELLLVRAGNGAEDLLDNFLEGEFLDVGVSNFLREIAEGNEISQSRGKINAI